MNGKVSDAIALEENIGTMKFVSISTPIPHPAIKITRPTITGNWYFDDKKSKLTSLKLNLLAFVICYL